MGTSQLGILTLPRLLAVEVLLAEPEALQTTCSNPAFTSCAGDCRGTPRMTRERAQAVAPSPLCRPWAVAQPVVALRAAQGHAAGRALR